MFSTISDGSKMAFYHLNQHLLDWVSLIDCQMMNPHLASLNVRPMHREAFLKRLADNDLSKTRLGSWSTFGSTFGSSDTRQASRRQMIRLSPARRNLAHDRGLRPKAPLDFYRHRPTLARTWIAATPKPCLPTRVESSRQRPINTCLRKVFVAAAATCTGPDAIIVMLASQCAFRSTVLHRPARSAAPAKKIKI